MGPLEHSKCGDFKDLSMTRFTPGIWPVSECSQTTRGTPVSKSGRHCLTVSGRSHHSAQCRQEDRLPCNVPSESVIRLFPDVQEP